MVVDVGRSSGDISPIDKVITTSHCIVQSVPKASCTYSAGMRHVKRMAAAFTGRRKRPWPMGFAKLEISLQLQLASSFAYQLIKRASGALPG